MTLPHAILNNVFRFSAFRGQQEDVINTVLAGQNALAVFPTGGGKSLCYQLPGIMLPGLTLVVSPLIALMKDQIDFLQEKGVAAARFDSSLTIEELREVNQHLRAGKLKLLYVSPERLSNERFVQSLRHTEISLMVVDEAHCISEWGHNFRPDYLKLVQAAQQVGAKAVLALTATATQRVGQDICQAFDIHTDNWYQDSFHRKNLELHLTPCTGEERLDLLLARLRERPKGPTIIYVTLQRTAEWLAERLSDQGREAAAYHAGFDGETRHAIQDAFMASQDGVVVATIAFGMGIDKPDIRYVYHFNMPKSLEHYAQEIGRAGRDGKSSICEVLVCPSDRIVLENFSYGDTPTDQAIRGVLDEILIHDGDFYISLYALSRKHDIRPLVLATLLTWLELKGIIVGMGQLPAEVRFQTERSSQEILEGFDPARADFLTGVFRHIKKGTKWLNIDVIGAAEALKEDPKRIMRALNYLDEKGEIQLEPKRFHKAYRLGNRADSIDDLVSYCVQRFEQRELADIRRLQKVLDLATLEGCRVTALLAYFGETLNGGRCSHCDFCLGRPMRSLPAMESVTLSAEKKQLIAELQQELHPALAHPRQLARFLCGLKSPATTRDKLTQHPSFGCLDDVPFKVVLAACEKSKRQ